MSEWTRTIDRLPPANIKVETKNHDEKGERNQQTLRYSSNLWWVPDMSMYVYYTPTHWRLKQ